MAALAIRWLAGASFSIYLVHYPAMQFVDAVLPDGMDTTARDLALLSLTLAACFCFAELFERPLKVFREAILASGKALHAHAGLQRTGPNV